MFIIIFGPVLSETLNLLPVGVKMWAWFEREQEELPDRQHRKPVYFFLLDFCKKESPMAAGEMKLWSLFCLLLCLIATVLAGYVTVDLFDIF